MFLDFNLRLSLITFLSFSVWILLLLLCTDKMVFHSQLRDTDLIIGKIKRSWWGDEWKWGVKAGVQVSLAFIYLVWLVFGLDPGAVFIIIKEMTVWKLSWPIPLLLQCVTWHVPWWSGTPGSFRLSKHRWLSLQKWSRHQRHSQPPENGRARP